MTTSAKTRPQKITSAREFVAAQTTPQTEAHTPEVAQTAAPAAIADNPFFQILLNDALDPQAKLAEVRQRLAFTKDRAEAQENLAAFNAFKDYLQFERKRMAQEIIALTDTEAFGELRSVFEEINTALVTFEQQITPLTDIVDAVYTLRMNGVTYDVFAELLREREDEKDRAAKVTALRGDLARIEATVTARRQDVDTLSKERGFLGLSGVPRATQDKIAAHERTIRDHTTQMRGLVDQIKALEAAPPQNPEFAEFSREKAKLRELLDISSDDHKARQDRLVDSAQAFIRTTETRVGSVLSHFDRMNGQIDNLDEANFTMRSMYAILNDAAREVAEVNEARRQEIKTAIDAADSDLERLSQQRQERDINAHIANLGRSNIDTTAVLAELTASEHRIHSMKEANEQQVSKTRQLHTSGVAGVADQLSTVLQAVSAAALGESSETAKMSLERMNRTTSELGQREVIRVALGTKEVNQDLSRALADLSDYGETIRAATDITRSGLSETKDLLARIERQTADTQAAVKDSLNVAADVAGGKAGARPSQTDAPDTPAPNPFNLGSA